MCRREQATAAQVRVTSCDVKTRLDAPSSTPTRQPACVRSVLPATAASPVSFSSVIIGNNNNASGRVFLSKLGRKLADQSSDDREISFLFQRLSVLIQPYNAILLHDCFVKEEE